MSFGLLLPRVLHELLNNVRHVEGGSTLHRQILGQRSIEKIAAAHRFRLVSFNQTSRRSL
jgi:hypothetical protein